jgi:hypothetical protein
MALPSIPSRETPNPTLALSRSPCRSSAPPAPLVLPLYPNKPHLARCLSSAVPSVLRASSSARFLRRAIRAHTLTRSAAPGSDALHSHPLRDTNRPRPSLIPDPPSFLSLAARLSIRLAPWIRSKPSLLKALQPIAQIYANACGYRQLGMRYDDLIQPWSNEVQTAIGRLSENEGYDRQFRIRASPPFRTEVAGGPKGGEEWRGGATFGGTTPLPLCFIFPLSWRPPAGSVPSSAKG